MRILFIFPFCSPEINSISAVPLYLGEKNHQVLVLTSQSANSLKGNVFSNEVDLIGNTEFFRPYKHSNDIMKNDPRIWDRTKKKILKFDPQVIIGFGESNFNLTLQIKREVEKPLIVFLEYIQRKPPMFPFKGRKWVRKYLPFFYKFLSEKYLKKIASLSDAIAFSYYGDIQFVSYLNSLGTEAFYVPWCSDIGDFVQPNRRLSNTGIYVGSLEHFKNAKELIRSISLVLDEMKDQKFIVVGPGSFAGNVIELESKYDGRLEYYKSIPRRVALEKISMASYGVTAVKDSGLGFIGDCWATKTPLVSIYDLNGFLNDEKDALIVNNINFMPNKIQELLTSPELYLSLQNQGYLRYKNSLTGKAVGERFLEIIFKVVSIQT